MKIVSYLPHGFSADSKQSYLMGLKRICTDVYGFPERGSSCYIHEYLPEDACNDLQGKAFVLFYTTAGKTKEQYQKTGESIEQLCKDAFGKDLSPTVVYREHTSDCIAAHGKIKSRM